MKFSELYIMLRAYGRHLIIHSPREGGVHCVSGKTSATRPQAPHEVYERNENSRRYRSFGFSCTYSRLKSFLFMMLSFFACAHIYVGS